MRAILLVVAFGKTGAPMFTMLQLWGSDALSTFKNELIIFFGLGRWIAMIQASDYSSLRTATGLLRATEPILALLLIIEIIRALLTKSFCGKQYRAIFLVYSLNRVLSSWLLIAASAFAIGVFSRFAPFSLGLTWYNLMYAYVVWELGHYIYHYLCHKVRILWCLHSTHHAPETMNLFVGNCHFFLENAFADFIPVSVCTVLGVSLPLLIVVRLVDGFWGIFIHASEHLFEQGRFGWLERFILTPSHHRVHHARNPIYIDTNYCNLLNFWDRAFGTFQPLLHEVPVEYGITRRPDAASFSDIYFGELIALGRDIWCAPGLLNKLKYTIMPPGWSHTGDHKTAAVLKDALDSRPIKPHQTQACQRTSGPLLTS